MENFKPALKYGLYLGLLAVLAHLIVYAINPEWFLAKEYGTLSSVLLMVAGPIVFMILGARDCKSNFSYYSFGKAFSAAFLVGITAAAVSLVYTLAFTTVIDPELNEWIYEEKLTQELEKLEDAGYSEAMLEQSKEMAGQFKKYTTGVLGSLILHGVSLFWYLILALIVGAVQKSKKIESESID